MIGATWTLRHSEDTVRDRDALLLPGLAIVHGLVLIAWPSMIVIAIGLWWTSNTVSHNFIHRSFFRGRLPRAIFSLYLTALLGYPQSIWAARHLAHHGGRSNRVKTIRPELLTALEVLVTIALWAGLAIYATEFLLYAYLPGFATGMLICQIHGYYEHAGGRAVSYYGRIYNFLFLNDGFHIEHHERPNAHWSLLPRMRSQDTCEGSSSKWPAVLRWMSHIKLDCINRSANLCALERLVLHSKLLQHFVVSRHENAFRRLLADIPAPNRIGIVGGGLFPRSALVLRRLLPESRLVLIDLSVTNLETSRSFLSCDVEMINDRFDGRSPCDVDALIIPLALVGDRNAIYRDPPASLVFVHDWIWKRNNNTRSEVISWLLLKRLNLVSR
jgi:Fatty acid desaturase